MIFKVDGSVKCMRLLPSSVVSKIDDNTTGQCTGVYPEVSGLAAWSENCKWYSSLPLGAVVSLLCESV
jgi:hypothetical protein